MAIYNDIIAKELINSELTRTNLSRGQGRILTQGPPGCNCIFGDLSEISSGRGEVETEGRSQLFETAGKGGS